MDGCLRRLLAARTDPRQPVIMGIVNVTPDSFSDGGEHLDPQRAIAYGSHLVQSGAQVLDIGGESTRPGALPVSASEEASRIVDVISALVERHPEVPISVDTSKAQVAERAIEAGAAVVNDVTAVSDPEMVPVCATAGVDLVLMHMRGTPRTMQKDTSYGDLIAEIRDYLRSRMEQAITGGVLSDRLIVDPGIGFGKAWGDNPRLISGLEDFRSLGAPVLVGASRKRFIGALTGQDRAADRVFGSVGAALAATESGAEILRVHDVAATREALAVFLACRQPVSTS